MTTTPENRVYSMQNPRTCQGEICAIGVYLKVIY